MVDSADENEEIDPSPAKQRHLRAIRPSFGSQCGSSLYDASVVTSSVYSIGEVRTARRSEFASAQAVALSTLSNEQDALAEPASGAQGLIESLMTSSEAVCRAAEAEEIGEAYVPPPRRVDPKENTLNDVPNPATIRGPAYATRPAPPPPQLASTASMNALPLSLPPSANLGGTGSTGSVHLLEVGLIRGFGGLDPSLP